MPATAFKTLLPGALLLLSCVVHAAPLSPSDRAFLDRITYGATPADIAAMERLGRDGYLRAQLSYSGDRDLPQPAAVFIAGLRISTAGMKDIAAELRSAKMDKRSADEAQKKKAVLEYRKNSRELVYQAFERRSVRALYSPAQLQEMMTWFWFNHFNVFQGKGLVAGMIPDYEENAIRPHVLGRFRDLLQATLTHPAMLAYLDNARNTKDRINENYARELMELHTLGVDSGYTQADVQALARVLTGATVDVRGTARARRSETEEGLFLFAPRLHDAGAKEFLGTHIEGSASFGEIEQVLDMLANHPATARFISTKLALYFYGDQPPAALIDRMSHVFLDSKGDISATLYAMFSAPGFSDATKLPPKFKDSVQYVFSSVRLLQPDRPIGNYLPLLKALNELGEPVYGHQTPEGYGMRQKDWASAGQLEKRFEFARSFGAARGGFDRSRIDALVADRYSPQSMKTIDAAGNDSEWASLVLSAPEFMYR